MTATRPLRSKSSFTFLDGCVDIGRLSLLLHGNTCGPGDGPNLPWRRQLCSPLKQRWSRLIQPDLHFVAKLGKAGGVRSGDSVGCSDGTEIRILELTFVGLTKY